MRFSDSTQLNIPKLIKYASSDSSPFNSDESQSDEDSSQKPIIPPTTSNCDFKTPSSNYSSPIKLHDNSFKKIIKTHQTDKPSDRLRHPSQNQSILPPPPIDRTTKTQYKLRHTNQKWIIDFLYHPQNFKTSHSLYWLNEKWSMKIDKTVETVNLVYV